MFLFAMPFCCLSTLKKDEVGVIKVRSRAPSSVFSALWHSAKLTAFIVFIQVQALKLSESSITRKSAILKY